jgi:hypothetical protein
LVNLTRHLYITVFATAAVIVIVILSLYFNPKLIYAASPAFSRQEINDANDDWLPFNSTTLANNQDVISNDRIINITGSSPGNIRSVSYISDGKTLNVTYWLTSSFEKIPSTHFPSYIAYIDADSNIGTGWNGIDYISEIKFDNKTKTWKSAFGELSYAGGYRSLKKIENFSGYDKEHSSSYVFLSLDLGLMDFPEQYRIIFLETDLSKNKYTSLEFQAVDYVNTAYIPAPKFIISTSPDSVSLVPGQKKTIEMKIKALNLIPSSSIQPKISFYNRQGPDNGIVLSFRPDQIYLQPDSSASSELTVDTIPSLLPHTYTVPLSATITFPSEFSGNPSVNITRYSNLTATVLDWSQRIKDLATDWINPISSIFAALIGVAGGTIGLILGKRSS